MTPNRTVAFHTLGCKLNFSETSTIAKQFEETGYARVDFSEPADIYVINTCSVTDHADKKCRTVVRRAIRNNPDAKVALIGCYSQLKPKEIASITGVDMVLGANEKFNLPERLNELESEGSNAMIEVGAIKDVQEFVAGYSLGDRTRSFMKVQDGCDYFCSFCTIPFARGRSRSATIMETVRIAQEIVQRDIREVVLTGVNIGDFGQDHSESFLGLLTELDDIAGIERFRISSIEPNLLSDEIIEFVTRSKRFMPHFHIPLQSGSDQILSAMRRKYDTQLYSGRIKKIKELMPHCCIGVDVIVGFPGESDAEFMKTYELLNELDVSYLHVFTYSERENTTAVKMKPVVPVKVRQERNRMLRVLSDKKRRSFYQQNIGREAEVLFEAARHDDFMLGYTDNYVRVKIPYNDTLINEFHAVELSGLDSDGAMNCQPVMEPA